MTLLEKIKINIDYLLGKADPSLYAPAKHRNLSSEDWQKRWEIFSTNGDSFNWFGVDSEGNLGEFICQSAYMPEAFFQDVSANKELLDFFWELPERTTTLLPENLNERLKKIVDDKKFPFWKTGANNGLFQFEETDGDEWYKSSEYGFDRPPYELQLIPKEPLNVIQLPEEIQKLLKSFHFESLKFADCQFLDVSKYFYCEE